MIINESFETCTKYQDYKTDWRVRGEEREIFEEILAQTDHMCSETSAEDQHLFSTPSKTNSRRITEKTISLKRKEKKYIWGENTVEWCVVRDSRVWMLEWHLGALRLNTKSTKTDICTFSNELLWKTEVKVQCRQIRQRSNNTQSIDLYYKIWQRNLFWISKNDVIRKHISQDRNIKL